MDSASDARGPLARAAASTLEDLRTAVPDTGDDATQVALDDVLLLVEERLAELAGEGS